MLLWVFKGIIVNGPLINTLSEGVFCGLFFFLEEVCSFVINDQIYVD